MLRYIIIYWIVINLVGYLAMKIDKSKARRGAWRIPEKTLFTIAALFGSVGVLLGMKHFRHKTKHNTFVYGIPAILILQVLIVLASVYVTYIR